MENKINNTQFNIECIKNVVIGRIEPSIYAFKTNTVPSYLKVGDTYRDVDVRLLEWNELYNDIFDIEENHKKINPVVDKSSVLNKNKDIYFRDYSVHEYLRRQNINQITEKEKKQFSKEHNNIHISNEFFKDAKGKDVENAIEDINNQYGKGGNVYEYYNVYDKGKEEAIYNATKEKNLRKNQEEVVDKFVEKYMNVKKGDKPLKLLMYAVMRFGKTFTALFCAKKVKAKVVVVLSAKADVHDEWRDNVRETIAFKNYKFISKNEGNLKDFNYVINGKYKQKEWMVDGKKIKEDKKDGVVVFLTLQDIQGDKIKKEHKDILKSDIDILIVDETHFGARAKSFGKVINNTEKENAKSDLVDENKNLKGFRNKSEDYYEIDKADKIIDDAVEKKFKSVKTILHLSGTPYRILMSSEFAKENRIAEITYNDILQSKKEWDDKFLKYDKVSDISDKDLKYEISKQYGLKDGEDKEIEEYDNPYYGFPNMLRFGYRPSEKSLKIIEEIKLKNDASGGLSNLLRPVSIVKDSKENYKKFRYEKAVLSIIKALDGKKEDKNIFPILKYEKDNNIVLSRHIVMVLPYCASCDAMEELLLKNKFNNLNEYEIINISGLDIKKEYKKVDNIKNKIEKIELRNFPKEYKEKYKENVNKNDKKKSITLTVERMLTGSTVPYWDTMIFMRDTKDPQGYDQAIFRLQNQYIKEYRDEKTNKVIKRDMKPQTLLIDFSIERMYRLTEEKEFIYNIKDNKRDNDKLQESLSKSLKNSQIFVTAENKMIEATPIDIMKIAARYNSEKSILDETKDIYFDKNILDNEKIRKELSKQQDMKNKGGLEIKKDEDDGNNQDLNFGEAKADDNGKNESRNDKDNSKINNFDLSDEDKLKKEWEGKWQTYCSRLLFYAFLTESEICSVDEIINYKNDKKNLDSNSRIIKNLDINIDTLKVLTEIVSDELLKNISDKIMNINTLSREEYDDEKDENGYPLSELDKKLKRIEVAMNKFSRLGKSEIVTPSNVCSDMIERFTEEQLKEVLNSEKKILDINSKIAEFTVAFIKRFKEMGITVDNSVYLKDTFYSIPSAGYTYEFTRYVYEKLGLNIDNIATHFTSYSLIKDENLCKSKDVELEINEQLKNIKKQLKEINKFNELDNMDELSNKQKQKFEELLNIYKDEDVEELMNGLEEELSILENKKSQNIDFEKVSNILNQDKIFSKIRLDDEIKGVEDMKFDIVVGNPPYQEADGGAQASATPIYQNFVYISKLLTNRYISIIMPSRWYAGGRGLEDFRREMLDDKHISIINDYLHPEEVFPNTNNRGGLCNFIWDKTYNNNNKIVLYTHYENNQIKKIKRELKINNCEIFIRDSKGINILEKIQNKNFSAFSNIVSSLRPYGLRGYFVKDKNYKKTDKNMKSPLLCYGKGKVIGFVENKYIKDVENSANRYKVFMPRANNIATELNDDNLNGFVGKPNEICTESYLVIGGELSLNKKSAENLVKYMTTKFMRYMHSLAKTSQDATNKTFRFVPIQDFTNNSDIDWSKSIPDIDKQLYKKYKLDNEEINFIEETIKAM